MTREQIEEARLFMQSDYAAHKWRRDTANALCDQALRAVSPVVDEEFVRVPREPTGVMRVMGGDQIQELHGAVSYDYLAMRVYKVMLAAMSSPPDSP